MRKISADEFWVNVKSCKLITSKEKGYLLNTELNHLKIQIDKPPNCQYFKENTTKGEIIYMYQQDKIQIIGFIYN